MNPLSAMFADMFQAMQTDTYENARLHGFQEKEANELYVPTKLALIMSECAEAIEWHRMGKSNEIGHELADVVIRTMDLAESLHINLGQLILEKHNFNKTRPYKHGNKAY